MTQDDNPRDADPKRDEEPSLKDALMPARPERAPQAGPSGSADESTPSLQDALLPEDHQPGAGPRATPGEVPEPDSASRAASPPPGSNRVVQGIVGLAIIVGFVVVFFVGRATNRPAPMPAETLPPKETPSAAATPATPAPPPESPDTPPTPTPKAPAAAWDDPGPMGLAEIQERGLIIDVHEHIESLEQAPMFLSAMDDLGIQKVCLMGSSKFTLTLDEKYGFTGYDENNEELIKIIEAYPERFEAWPTISPTDPDKLKKIQDLVARGATGVKLYIGHGYIAKDNTYMFHTIAMDDEQMLPLYAWCEENAIPLAFHVNPYKAKVGFAQEFIAVLTQFPDMKVIAPHFILSSVKSSRLEELLDTFPNLYSDISFGDYFMKERLQYMSKYPKKFREIFNKYPRRFMFATDLVMIRNRPADWAPTQFQAYIDMLTKETFTTDAIPGETLNGLALSDELVSRVLFRNYREFRARRPEGTLITREIDWERMNVEPVERTPGQAFPPQPKNR